MSGDEDGALPERKRRQAWLDSQHEEVVNVRQLPELLYREKTVHRAMEYEATRCDAALEELAHYKRFMGDGADGETIAKLHEVMAERDAAREEARDAKGVAANMRAQRDDARATMESRGDHVLELQAALERGCEHVGELIAFYTEGYETEHTVNAAKQWARETAATPKGGGGE